MSCCNCNFMNKTRRQRRFLTEMRCSKSWDDGKEMIHEWWNPKPSSSCPATSSGSGEHVYSTFKRGQSMCGCY
ncbi:putative ribosome biogenesis protein BOP1-like protein isoform X1 [Sesbania bispinosa]|nr:putative ribosome biogenesis protein BOP1-like protein isoform X1 [Sesbania bispinosa]